MTHDSHSKYKISVIYPFKTDKTVENGVVGLSKIETYQQDKPRKAKRAQALSFLF